MRISPTLSLNSGCRRSLYQKIFRSLEGNFIRVLLGAHASSVLTASRFTGHARCVRSQEASSPRCSLCSDCFLLRPCCTVNLHGLRGKKTGAPLLKMRVESELLLCCARRSLQERVEGILLD